MAKKRKKKAKKPGEMPPRYAPPKYRQRGSLLDLSEELFRKILKEGRAAITNHVLITQITENLGNSLRKKVRYVGCTSSASVWEVKGVSSSRRGPVYWHGTSMSSLPGLLQHGLLPSQGGMLGPGVYLGDLDKARNYTRSGSGILLKCRADLGKVQHISIYTADCKNLEVDTLTIGSGVDTGWGSLRHREWCVRDPRRVQILEIHILTPNN